MIEPLVLFLVGVAIVALRTYARVRVVGWKHLESDDYIMFFVAFFYASGTAFAYVAGTYWHGLTNGSMTPEQRAALSPDSDEYQWRVNGSKAYLAIWVSFSLVLWLQKGAMLAFFIRLTSRLGDYTKIIRFGFLFVSVSYISIVLVFFLDCLPLERNWQVNPYPGGSCIPADVTTLSVVLSLNIATDIYILAIPLPIFWMAHIKYWKKLGLLVLVSGNIFIIAVAIVRVCLIIGDPLHGSQQAAPWTYRVMFVSVVSTNAPMLAPLLRKWLGSMSRALFGEKPTEKGMMREIQIITVIERTDVEALPADLDKSRFVRARQARRPSAITSGSQTMVETDDGDSDKIQVVVETEGQHDVRRPSSRPCLSDEHPV
ncbi:uncharacterized protein B0I36DRAFT_5317 [Microdochium trichocladiopsis]|uniref:Rhodopsin domain-containing protein n=1 Tax=Microdochium trichocladiopsis TaxID=1682393 RepID=A0A9P8YHK4_9PEZI|nr:uncharacterized protein B0I36DRAFT_5317 [Microdochium trichocladiopsis]KAH7040083.1 hypothetical protein B0I36DRAFT_5317 [Microdochium trichocladiopsis]